MLNEEQPLLIYPAIKSGNVAALRRRYPEPQPQWCSCGQCLNMENRRMNVCCNKTPCITQDPVFHLLCLCPCVILVAGILNYAVAFREMGRMDPSAWRNRGYRFFALWQYGVLGGENRRCPPSCCVLRIRHTFPSRDERYTGYESFAEDEDTELD